MNLDGIINSMTKQEAIHSIKNLINNGSIEAMHLYGLIVQYNKYGVDINKEEAAYYFKISAEKGNIYSMLEYGLMLFNGVGVSKNEKEGIKYIKMSADEGLTEAMINYGEIIFKEGKIDEAIEYSKMAIDYNDNNAMFLYGEILYKGDKIPVNKKEAAKYFKMSADNGNIEGANRYGIMSWKGDGIPINLQEAAKYFKILADQGDSVSMYHYTAVLTQINEYKNESEMIKYLKMSADKGLAYSMHNLGLLLLKRESTELNIKQATELFKKAADLGNVLSMLKYGFMKYFDQNIENDKEEGLKYIKISYNKNDKSSQFYIDDITFMYMNLILCESIN